MRLIIRTDRILRIILRIIDVTLLNRPLINESNSFMSGFCFRREDIMKAYYKTENGFDIIVEKEFYEREAVYAVAYQYSGILGFSFSPVEPNKIKISIFEKNGRMPTEKDAQNILTDLLDEQFKIEILKRTEKVRDMVYKKAFLPLQEQGK